MRTPDAHTAESEGVARPNDAQRPLRVTMLIQSYHPIIGGGERQLQTLTGIFPRFGIQTTVITRRHPGPEFIPEETIANARVVRIKLRGGKALRSLSYTLGALGLIWRERKQTDVLHSHDLLSPTTTAVLARLLTRRRVVATILGAGNVGDIAKLYKNPGGRARMKLFTRLVDRFITLSNEITEDLRAAGVPGAKIVRIPNGVDTDLYRPATAEERVCGRAALGLPDGPIVLFLARLNPVKGLRTLIGAWEIVHASHPDAHLVIVGEGPERTFLESSGAPNMHLMGPHTNAFDFMRAADIYVLPSLQEGLPNSLMEAMACGLACIATPVSGSVELIEHGKRGMLFEVGDHDALARAISQALEDEPLRQRMGDAARAYVLTNYPLEATVRALRALYDSLSTRHSGSRKH